MVIKEQKITPMVDKEVQNFEWLIKKSNIFGGLIRNLTFFFVVYA
jgi:hypothetical protein